MSKLNRVCIIGGKRIPFMRSSTKYMGISNNDLMVPAMKALVEELNLQGEEVGEVVLGAVNKHAYQFSLARECVMDSGLNARTPATDIQKACGTSLEAAITISNKIATGQIDCGIAAGVDTNSDVPIEFKKLFSDRLLKLAAAKTFGQRLGAFKGFHPKELLPKLPAIKEPRTGKSMGESCEEMAKSWNITRHDQDLLAIESHQKALKAYEVGFYDDIIINFKGHSKDGLVRSDTTLDKLAKLSPAFDRKSGKGTLTAGNSSALTDGASCTFLCSEDYAKKNGYEPLAFFTNAQSAAVDYLNEEGLLMAPAYAVPKLLAPKGINTARF